MKHLCFQKPGFLHSHQKHTIIKIVNNFFYHNLDAFNPTLHGTGGTLCPPSRILVPGAVQSKVSDKTQNVPKNVAHSKVGSVGS